MKIAVYYHCLFVNRNAELYPASVFIVSEQMQALEKSGLLAACDQLVVGINGEPEISKTFANLVIPDKARIVYHGADSFAENLTLVEMEKFAKDHQDWLLCYHHAKSATHDPQSDYGKFATRWRRCMETTVIWNWRECVKALQNGYEAVGNHWLTGQGYDHSQHYFAGNTYWVTAKFFATIPSIFTRERIKISGIAALDSRYEAEVILGNGPRLPRVKDMATHGLMACPEVA